MSVGEGKFGFVKWVHKGRIPWLRVHRVYPVEANFCTTFLRVSVFSLCNLAESILKLVWKLVSQETLPCRVCGEMKHESLAFNRSIRIALQQVNYRAEVCRKCQLHNLLTLINPFGVIFQEIYMFIYQSLFFTTYNKSRRSWNSCGAVVLLQRNA